MLWMTGDKGPTTRENTATLPDANLPLWILGTKR
jgi:hypothetical protein